MKYLFFITICLFPLFLNAQTVENIQVNTKTRFQTVVGFGASLAYYENWLTAHPYKNEIYNAIFRELSLDILRVRNAYEYDSTMIQRVAEFYQAAEESLGEPIKTLSTSWGPPARLKSNNDRKNGGTLKYAIENDTVKFDYAGFANWWDESLNEYNNKGIYLDFISIQNEPDFEANWESCLLRPTETINATDTIAGYNKALEAIHNIIEQREKKPMIIGPETVGIGYNSVQNYVNTLNTSYIDGIAHHLYHGVDENNPWVSTKFSEVAGLYPEIPHFQTEYSRGDWFSLAGLMHKTFNDEKAVAYLYWDLIWDGGGLVDLEFPWNNNDWTSERGYIKTKDFFAFKQYSAFIHPGWVRIETTDENKDVRTLAFMNPSEDSVSIILVNKSETDSVGIKILSDDFAINGSSIYRTSENENCAYLGELDNLNFGLPKKSITTMRLSIEEGTTQIADTYFGNEFSVYPNPFVEYAILKLPKKAVNYNYLKIFDTSGKIVRKQNIKQIINSGNELMIYRHNLKPGMYVCIIASEIENPLLGKFIIK